MVQQTSHTPLLALYQNVKWQQTPIKQVEPMQHSPIPQKPFGNIVVFAVLTGAAALTAGTASAVTLPRMSVVATRHAQIFFRNTDFMVYPPIASP